MKLTFSTRIHQSADSLSAALLKKADNHTFSAKTARKLVGIASREVNLSSIVGRQIFFNSTSAESILVDSEAINKLHVVLKGCLKYVRNEDAGAQFNNWLANCAKMLPVERNKDSNSKVEQKDAENKANADRLQRLKLRHGKPELLAIGSNGRVSRLGDYIIKQFNQFDTAAIWHELNMCNSYNASVCGRQNSAYLVGQELVMPYIEGKVPSTGEVLDAVKSLHEQGYMMGDPKPDNFKVTGDSVVPVDFGQVFKVDEHKSLDGSVKYSVVNDYLKGGHNYVHGKIKAEYQEVLMALDESLGKNSPSRYATVSELKNLGYEFGLDYRS
ncbi:hypothetical protein BK658_19715 [Pseudomonas brassicacearum]|uniref:Uncharacterized protein n=2 Tax=Pseudomonas brassicacearum TaxID=930166 RepID=A0A423GNG5_9PSED|nr:hypothetical protein BK658_19715 [Pseudomonas brassicacearum]